MLVCNHCRRVYMSYEIVKTASSVILKRNVTLTIIEPGRIVSMYQGNEKLVRCDGDEEELAVCPRCTRHLSTFYSWATIHSDDNDIVERFKYFMDLVEDDILGSIPCLHTTALTAEQLIKFKQLTDILDKK